MAIERRLTAFDDYFIHQKDEPLVVVDDPEGPWLDRGNFYIFDRDGSFYLAVGLGSYANAGVMDGFASIVDGHTQHNLRVSRHMQGERTHTRVGPLSCQVTAPLSAWQLDLAPNSTNLAFSIEFRGRMAPFLFKELEGLARAEGKMPPRQAHFTQFGFCRGWAEVAGKRTEGDFFCARDRSWGMRAVRPLGLHLWIQVWLPGFCLAVMHDETKEGERDYSDGAVLYDNGDVVPVLSTRHHLEFEEGVPEHKNAEFRFDLANGKELVVTSERCHRGWFLTGGGYGGFQGKSHGELHEEGEIWDLRGVTTTGTGALPPFSNRAYDQLARFQFQDERGAGIIETTFTRSQSWRYRPTC